jgi:Gas vesicle synthesis protein GvpL/GvpF
MSKQERQNVQGFYVYCIADTGAAQAIAANDLPSPIEENAGIEMIAQGDLTAVTSAVSLSSYGEEGLAEHLGDAAWTAVRAMRHERVVEHFARRTSVVPLRFGTIYLERASVEQMLSERGTELKTIIERIRDREEWGVNVFCDRIKLIDAIDDLSPRLRKLSEEARKASPGQSYLLQKKLEGLKADEARKELGRMIDEIESKLSGEVDGTKRLRVLKVEATESGELKAKFAFLVQRSKFDRFRAEAERLATEVHDTGIRLELTGPWPAYNFAQ